MSLKSAFAVHLATVVLAFLLIMWLGAIDERKTVAYELATAFRELPRDWLGKIVVVGLFTLMIEGGFLLFAFLLMPWGAGDERLRSSWKHALRVTWLHTTHALPLILIVGAVAVLCGKLEREFYDTNPFPEHNGILSDPPALPNQATPEQRREYARLVERQKQARAESEAQNQAAWEAWEARRPWIAKYSPAVIMWFIAFGTAWFLWALLRAVGVERLIPPIAHPPTCEFCGYNLTGAALDGRCPECGRLVAESLGPETRPGTDWSRRHEIGRWHAWWRCAVDAIRRPTMIGRQIRVCSHVTDHRGFLAMHVPAGFAIGAAVAIGMLLLLLVTIFKRGFEGQAFQILQLFIPLGGTIGGLVVLVVAMLAAGVVGLIRSLKNGRNLLPAAMQIAAYLSGFLVVWACFAGITISCMTVANINPDSMIGPWARQMRINRDILVFLCCFLLNLPWLAVYLVALWRGTTAAQHANK